MGPCCLDDVGPDKLSINTLTRLEDMGLYAQLKPDPNPMAFLLSKATYSPLSQKISKCLGLGKGEKEVTGLQCWKCRARVFSTLLSTMKG